MALNAYGAFSTPFCASIDVANERLKRAIEDAERSGMGSAALDAAYQNALAIYDAHTGLDSSIIYVPFMGNDCKVDTDEVNAAATRLVTALNAAGFQTQEEFRPDAQTPTDYSKFLTPALWLGGLLAAGYVLNSVASAKKAFGGYRRRTRRSR